MTQPRSPAISVVVVGDVLLDQDITGEVSCVSAEAPVPVVSSLCRDFHPGGAGRAAIMVAQEGHDVSLVTALGADQEAQIVGKMLDRQGVHVINMGSRSATTVKTRVRSFGQILLMLDDTSPTYALGALPPAGVQVIESASAVLVSDYGRGVAAAKDVRSILGLVATRIPVVWDPHRNGPRPVPGVALATPNSSEARHFAPGNLGVGLKADVENARYLRRKWRARGVAVTRGAEGAILVSGDASPPLVISCQEGLYAYDTCGAGDRLAVTATYLLGAGAIPSAAVAGGVTAATDYVTSSQGGTRAPRSSAGEDAVAMAERVRAAGGTVVAAGGCFDLLHRGHIALLDHARQLGDLLIVCLNSDSSVGRVKGSGRPLVAERDRADVLAALSCVDAVIIFEEDSPAEVLSQLRPHIYVKGADYGVGDISEAAVVRSNGGQVVLVPYLDGRSTSSLIEQAHAAGHFR